MKFEVIIYYALLAGDCGVESHNLKCNLTCGGTNMAIVEAMRKVKHQERFMLSDGYRRIHWERAFWKCPGDKDYKEACLTLLNIKGLSEIINP